MSQQPIKFAYWVPNVSGGLVVSTIEQRTRWDIDYNRTLARTAEAAGFEYALSQIRFTAGYGEQRQAVMTVSNGEGNYFADEETLDRLEGEGQVVFRYKENPNGSARDIAGIVNKGGNVLGLMPHPDRAFDADLGSEDGAVLFRSVFQSA